jgi:hypothetical protein
MKNLLTIASIIICAIHSIAQNTIIQKTKEDSLLNLVNAQTSPNRKIDYYLKLAELYLGDNSEKEDEYINLMIFNAEETRDRRLILETINKASKHYFNFLGAEGKDLKIDKLIEKGLTIAKENSMYDMAAVFLMRRAAAESNNAKFEKALKNLEDAVSYAELTDIDTLKINVKIAQGKTLISNTLFASKRHQKIYRK